MVFIFGTINKITPFILSYKIPKIDRKIFLSIFEYSFADEHIEKVIFIQSGFVFVNDILHIEGNGIGFEAQSRSNNYEAITQFELRKLRNLEVSSFLRDKLTETKKNREILVLPRIGTKFQWHSSIKVRKELVFSGLLRSGKNEKGKDNFKKLAILVPSKNHEIHIKDCVLLKYLIPNLKKTITQEDLKIINEITLYVGYDADDLLEKKENQKYIEKRLPKYLNIKFYQLPRTNWVTFIWNYLFVESVNDQNDYFLQINDDIIFFSKSWISRIVSKIGLNGTSVIGLNDKVWKCKLYTQSLVNSKHYKNFDGQYFPLAFANWYSDTWLTLVYHNHGGICDNETLIQNIQFKRRYAYTDNRNFDNSLKIGIEILNLNKNMMRE